MIPYQPEIRNHYGHYCGATLVKVSGIQVGGTSAQCVHGLETYPFQLVAREIDQRDNSGIKERRITTGIVVHQNFSGYRGKNDIVLLFVKQSYQLNDKVKTAPFPVQGQVTSQGSLKVSGRGDLEYQGISSDPLQIVEIPLVDDTECVKAYQDYNPKVDDNMICAGSSTGDVSPCNGDTGGSAVSDAGYLAGNILWGYAARQTCGHPDYPAAFTKVVNYVDRIHASVRDYPKSL